MKMKGFLQAMSIESGSNADLHLNRYVLASLALSIHHSHIHTY